MRNLLTKILLGAALLTGGVALSTPALHAQVSFGIRIGPPPAPRVVRTRPPRPGPDYVWVDGYWYAENGRYRWLDGYWTLPPYPSAHWVQPRYQQNQFFTGYWDGDRGRFDHDHAWDRTRERDGNRFREGLRNNNRDRDQNRNSDRDQDRDNDRDRH